MPTTIIIACILVPYFILIIVFQVGINMLRVYRPTAHPVDLKVSVIVPFRNEASNLKEIAEDLKGQDYHRDQFEMLFVDDHSEDGGRLELADALDGFPNARIISSPDAKGKMAALRKGLQEASFDCVVVTDADCRPGKGWLRTMASFWSEKGSRLVIGPVLYGPLRGWASRIQALEFLSLTGITAGAAGLRMPIMGSGANMMFRREDLLEFMDHADPGAGSGEDVFFVGWMRKRHPGRVRYLFSEEAFMFTAPAVKAAEFIGQRIRWASKGRYYRDPLLVTVTLAVFLLNLCLTGLLAGSFFVPGLFGIFLFVLAGKGLADLIFLTDACMKFRQAGLLKVFLPFELMQPVYIVSAGILGNLLSYTWKGRLGRAVRTHD